jgi:hypothetical protein
MNRVKAIDPLLIFFVAIMAIWATVTIAGMAVAADRSGRWPAVRDTYLEAHPACEACGCKDEALNVHHVEPFEFAPERELDPTNLITLCNKHHCHLMVGHLSDWHSFNPNVREDAARMLLRIKSRPYSREDATKFQAQFQTAL